MHWYIEVGSAIKEIGIPIVAFGLLCWLVVFIVKRLASSIDAMVARFDVFCTAVRKEHITHDNHHINIMDNQKSMQDNQKRIAQQLQETAVVLGRINGYRP